MIAKEPIFELCLEIEYFSVCCIHSTRLCKWNEMMEYIHLRASCEQRLAKIFPRFLRHDGLQQQVGSFGILCMLYILQGVGKNERKSLARVGVEGLV